LASSTVITRCDSFVALKILINCSTKLKILALYVLKQRPTIGLRDLNQNTLASLIDQEQPAKNEYDKNLLYTTIKIPKSIKN
jgi:hypothetical protein